MRVKAHLVCVKIKKIHTNYTKCVKLHTECKCCLTLDVCKMIYTLYKPYTKVCKVTHVGQITHFVQDYTLCCIAYKVVLNRKCKIIHIITFFAFILVKFTPDRKNLHRHRLWCLWQIWGMGGGLTHSHLFMFVLPSFFCMPKSSWSAKKHILLI